ncbi:MAG: carboxypeptidase-like regulatory domain-containing protein [Planctomycetota bacterium]
MDKTDLDVVLVLSPAEAIEGRVLDPAGQPVSEAEVRAYPPGYPHWLASSSSDALGRFRIEVPPEFVGRIQAFRSGAPEDAAVVEGVPAGRHDLGLVIK